MKQILTIGFGQAGVNISEAVLELYLREHSLGQQTQSHDPINDVFFQQNSSGSYTYRSLFLDSDPYTRDQILSKKTKKFMKKDQFICGKRSTGGLYSGGKIVAQKQLNEISLQIFQKMLEACDNPQGIIINTSMLGGASGIFSSFVQKIAGQNYLQKKTVLTNAILPSRHYSNSIIEQYNYCLSFKTLNDYSNLAITCDNQSLYQFSQTQGIQSPGLSEANKLLAKMQSSLTLPYRSFGPMACDLHQIATNIVCYPRINLVYPSASFISPFSPFLQHSTLQMTKNLFLQSSRFFDTRKIGSKIAVALSYRGNFSPFDVKQSLKQLKDTPGCNFVEWSPLGFKVGITNEFRLPIFKNKTARYIESSQKSCFSLTSSMQYNGALGENNLHFDKLYAKRAFIHWFMQGTLEEGQFSQSRQNLAALQKDYQEWQPLLDYSEEQ